MAKDIFDSILEKDYHQLSQKELTELKEICQSENEFNVLKAFGKDVKSIANAPKLTPSVATKERLDEVFATAYGSTKKGVVFYRKGWFQLAASIVLIIGIGLVYLYTNNTPITPQLAQNTITENNVDQSNEEKSDNQKNISSEMEKDELALEKQSAAVINEKVIQKNTTVAPIPNQKETSFTVIKPVLAEKKTEVVSEDSEIAKTGNTSTNSLNKQAQEKIFQSYSAPATSAMDIQVESSKRTSKTSALTSMNSSSQNSVFNFLVVKY
ncbi:MAG: hypothetical protein M9916_08110 [Crocinitomicaceae bacterium]|nr:hypothetical protein [Crocinitomicaceae bacterium]